MGGAGTIFLGQKHAEEWAALAAIAPAAFMMQRDQKDVLAPIKAAGLPLMITQGDADPVVPPAKHPHLVGGNGRARDDARVSR
jgi:hypothetical protein